MNTFQTLILSIIEGITEFLPISSTGHLILASKLLGINQTEFVKSFEIIIQLGAIFSVVVIYFKKLILKFDINLYKKLLVSFIPSTVFGLIFYKYIKSYLIGNSMVVALSLLIGGIIMIVFEKYYKVKPKNEITYKDYFAIGMFQVLSMVPGVSRAFATIFGGMVVGLNKKEATEYSFLLAIPTMLAASVLDLVKTDISVWTKSEYQTLAVGFVGSFVVAYLVVKWFINYVQTNKFVVFGIYRIIIAVLFLTFINYL